MTARRYSGRAKYHRHNGMSYQLLTVYLRDSVPVRTFLSVGLLCPLCGFSGNERWNAVTEAANRVQVQPRRNSYPIITVRSIKDVAKSSHTVIE